MYNPLEEYAKAHQIELLQEARLERSLSALHTSVVSQAGQPEPWKPGLRDRLLLLAGDWMIALGRRLHGATRCCASQPLSEGRV